MARVTHVKRAQQRYHTKPIIDPATGEQKQVPVMNSRGEQKTTKGGRPVFLRLTERDLDRPKPLFRCDFCKEEIALGTPYKWIEPHGRGMMTRHEGCPTWQVWEYSNSLSARISQIQADGPDAAEFEDEDGIKGWLEAKAQEIRDLAEEKREAATNIEEGFQHATYQSDELNETADQLDSWADEVEQADIPELPEPEDEECTECGGTGGLDDGDGGSETCDECGGSGQVTPETLSEEQLDEWRENAVSAAQDALDNCPL